jgi:spore coat polysaccharide biosynthesis protein SpsF
MAILGAIIVARMDSRRFPGKVLHPIAGEPMLGRVIQRCRQVRAIERRIIIATTARPVDHPLARYAASHGLSVFRGETENVAGRVLECARAADWDGFFRVNADSPCLEPALLEEAAKAFDAGGYDLVTNLFPRSFPYGISVELLRTSAYAEAYSRFDRHDHREHVTLYLYEHSEQFRLHNLSYPRPMTPGKCSQVPPRLTVDTLEDVAPVEAWLAAQPDAPLPVPVI